MHLWEPWQDYATTDERGLYNGVREDAPQWAKDAYEDWVERRKNDRNEYGCLRR